MRSLFRRPAQCLRPLQSKRRSSILAASRPSSAVFQVSEEVRSAVNENRPVVALETTIYTHGFPYPQNVELSNNLEAAIRRNGAIPATIGVLNGVAKVGLTPRELVQVVESPNAWKLSRRDLGFIAGLGLVGERCSGGTTIAGTMVLAQLAGIRIFATGGLGGVHRSFNRDLDVSADLTEFNRTPVTVISSGCKGFLDIPRTLEFLETQGAAVGTFADGREGNVEFPAFWSRGSGLKSPRTIRDETEAAAVILAQQRLGLQSGIFLANPIPEEYSIPTSEMADIIEKAIHKAEMAGATGASNTPFILDAIKDLTSGRSIQANRGLILSNVIRGAKVAVELEKLEKAGQPSQSTSTFTPIVTSSGPSTSNATESYDSASSFPWSLYDRDGPQLVVAGSIALDSACDYRPLSDSPQLTYPAPNTSNPASISSSVGGVGYNIALAASYLGAKVRLCSFIGNDTAAGVLKSSLKQANMDVSDVHTIASHKSAQYVAVNNKAKQLVVGMADMSIYEDASYEFNAHTLLCLDGCHDSTSTLTQKPWLALDANWNPSTLKNYLKDAKRRHVPVAFEPVSDEKSTRVFQRPCIDALTLFPNQAINIATPTATELEAMHEAASSVGALSSAGPAEDDRWFKVINALGLPNSAAAADILRKATSSDLVERGIPQRAVQLLPYIPNLVVKLGEQGVLLARILTESEVQKMSGPDTVPFIVSRAYENELGIGGLYMRLFSPSHILGQDQIASVNGAGDTFLGTIMAGIAVTEGRKTIDELVPLAMEASAMTLRSTQSVSSELVTLRDSITK